MQLLSLQNKKSQQYLKIDIKIYYVFKTKKKILGVLAIGILLGITNQDFIFSVLAAVIHKLYFADYAEFEYEITYCPQIVFSINKLSFAR